MTSSSNDKELIFACQRGEESAYLELVSKYQDRVYWIAFNFVKNREDAQDIAQEAFIRIYKNIHKFQAEKIFEIWLYRIVVNLAIDVLRKRKIQTKQSLDPLPEPESNEKAGQSLEAEEAKKQIQAVLEQLPDKYRHILILRDLEGFTSKEISDILKENHATIRWYLHKARKMFKEFWIQLYPQDKIDLNKETDENEKQQEVIQKNQG